MIAWIRAVHAYEEKIEIAMANTSSYYTTAFLSANKLRPRCVRVIRSVFSPRCATIKEVFFSLYSNLTGYPPFLLISLTCSLYSLLVWLKCFIKSF